jgi:hypothetical protein
MAEQVQILINIVESGVKHHNSNLISLFLFLLLYAKDEQQRIWFIVWIYTYLSISIKHHCGWVRFPFICGEMYLIRIYMIYLLVGQWFCPGTLLSSSIETDHHDTTEILSFTSIFINYKPDSLLFIFCV